jgi:6-pyruvoyltetrahydropterin/6-carboxytetrahydropterin synthase
MVVELGALRHVIQEVVIEPLDHRFLNKDIPHFETRVPTAENIAIYIRDLLLDPLQELGLSLEKLRLYESPNNSCELYGTMGGHGQGTPTQEKTTLLLV